MLLLETVIAIPDLEAAVEAIRKASEQPIWATFSFDAQGELDGMSPREVARRAQAIGLQAFGYGCGFGLDASRLVLEELRTAAPHATLIAKPNLGLPRGGRYDVTPDQAARWAAGVAELGIRIVGLCCGSTPAHIRAIASKLEPDC